MNKEWIKSAVTIVMAVPGQEKAVRKTYNNLGENVTAAQIKELVHLIEVTSDVQITGVELTTVNNVKFD